MMNTTEISLDLKNTVTDIYRRYGNKDSAHCFESIYIWRQEMGLSIVCTDDLYTVQEASKGPFSWFFPVGSADAKEAFIKKQLEDDDPQFYYMTPEDVTFLEQRFPGRFDIYEAPESSEYIMSREIMEKMPGSSFSKDRGHINKMLRDHSFETVNIRAVPKSVVYDISAEWDASKHIFDNLPDKDANISVIEHMDDLDIEGIVLYMDGSPCAVCGGFQMSTNTVDCVIQKTSLKLQGLTYYLRQEYARSLSPDIVFLNWEEDLGIEGLRRAKQLMQPVDMIKMYTGKAK